MNEIVITIGKRRGVFRRQSLRLILDGDGLSKRSVRDEVKERTQKCYRWENYNWSLNEHGK